MDGWFTEEFWEVFLPVFCTADIKKQILSSTWIWCFQKWHLHRGAGASAVFLQGAVMAGRRILCSASSIGSLNMLPMV